MKRTKNRFLVGLGGAILATLPLVFWAFDIRAKFLCPNCKKLIRPQKLKGNFKEKISSQSTEVEKRPKISPEIA